MTIQEAKDKVAQKLGWDNWFSIPTFRMSASQIMELADQVCKLYASQFSEEIEKRRKTYWNRDLLYDELDKIDSLEFPDYQKVVTLIEEAEEHYLNKSESSKLDELKEWVKKEIDKCSISEYGNVRQTALSNVVSKISSLQSETGKTSKE